MKKIGDLFLMVLMVIGMIAIVGLVALFVITCTYFAVQLTVQGLFKFQFSLLVIGILLYTPLFSILYSHKEFRESISLEMLNLKKSFLEKKVAHFKMNMFISFSLLFIGFLSLVSPLVNALFSGRFGSLALVAGMPFAFLFFLLNVVLLLLSKRKK